MNVTPVMVGIALAVAAEAGGGTWVARGPSSAYVDRLCAAPSASNVVYAVVDFAELVFRSTDGGSTWTLASGGLPDAALGQLAVDATSADTVYLKVGQGIYTTTDGGASWAPCAALPDDAYAAVTAHPELPGVVLASTAYDLWRSDDGCASWTHLGPGTAPDWVTAIVFDPFSASSMLTKGIGYHRSDDAGTTWRRIPGYEGDVAFSSSQPGVLYLAGHESWAPGVPPALFKSADGGDHWTPIASFPEPSVRAVGNLAVVPGAPETHLVAWGADRLRSTDEGATWEVMTENIKRWIVTASGIVYAAAASCTAGVARSDDAGETWASSATGLAAGPTLAMAFGLQPSPLLYAGAFCAGIQESSDHGATWVPSSCPVFVAAALATCGAAPWAVYALEDGRALARSDDGGASWETTVAPEEEAYTGASCDPRATGTVYVVGEHLGGTTQGALATMWRSSDGGVTWYAAWGTASYQEPYFIRPPVFSAQSPTTLYAASAKGVIKSTDGGHSFELLASLPGPVNDLAVEASSPERIWAATASGASISSDGGETWKPSVPPPCANGLERIVALPLAGRVVAAGCNRVFGSSWGSSWSELAPGLPDRRILSLAVDPVHPGEVAVGTRAGVFTLSLQTVMPRPRRVLRSR
jgi:photosystem II stability/assembly factor-like uncharacterized protein